MRIAIADAKEFYAGALFVAIGGGTLVQLPAYDIGTATRMGPGYFPLMLGIFLVALGVIAIARGVRAPADSTPGNSGTSENAIGPWPLRPLVFLTAGIVAFAGLILTAGLAAALACLVLLGCYDRLRTRPLEVAIIYLALLGLVAGIFIQFVQLPIALW